MLPNCTDYHKNDTKPYDCGSGGFAPFGFDGIMKGAATAFFGFVGFDAIATTGEEVKNPRRAIPIGILLSLLIIFIFYFLISLTVTMIMPYYLLAQGAPLAEMFKYHGMDWAQYIVGAGALCALTTSLLGGMFPLPRVILSMARDGLLFKFFAIILPRFQTPFYATIVTGIFAGIIAALFDIDALVNMMSIGTLMAYSLVSLCALLLRYESAIEDYEDTSAEFREQYFMAPTMGEFIRHMFTPKDTYFSVPVRYTQNAVKILAVIAAFCIVLVCALLRFVPSYIFIKTNPAAVLFFALGLLGAVGCSFIIWRQPESKKPLYFKTPLMPLVPLLSVFCNVYLMFQLDYMTWVRFLVWFAVGLILYVFYSWWNSVEERGGYKKALTVLDMLDLHQQQKQEQQQQQQKETDEMPNVYYVNGNAAYGNPNYAEDEGFDDKF